MRCRGDAACSGGLARVARGALALAVAVAVAGSGLGLGFGCPAGAFAAGGSGVSSGVSAGGVAAGGVSAGGVSAGGVAASPVPGKSRKVVVSYLKGDPGNRRSYRGTAAVSEVASSNPRVVSAAGTGYGFDLTVRRAGKAKVSYLVGGQRRTLSFTVRKYSRPVKSFKLGGRDYAGKLKSARSCKAGKRRRDLGKVSVKAAKGWRLKRIYTGFSERNGVRLRNGSRAGGAVNVRAVLVHKASGLVETVEVRNGG